MAVFLCSRMCSTGYVIHSITCSLELTCNRHTHSCKQVQNTLEISSDFNLLPQAVKYIQIN